MANPFGGGGGGANPFGGGAGGFGGVGSGGNPFGGGGGGANPFGGGGGSVPSTTQVNPFGFGAAAASGGGGSTSTVWGGGSSGGGSASHAPAQSRRQEEQRDPWQDGVDPWQQGRGRGKGKGKSDRPEKGSRDKGYKGDKGEKGEKGYKADKGGKGDKGSKGEKGKTGKGEKDAKNMKGKRGGDQYWANTEDRDAWQSEGGGGHWDASGGTLDRQRSDDANKWRGSSGADAGGAWSGHDTDRRGKGGPRREDSWDADGAGDSQQKRQRDAQDWEGDRRAQGGPEKRQREQAQSGGAWNTWIPSAQQAAPAKEAPAMLRAAREVATPPPGNLVWTPDRPPDRPPGNLVWRPPPPPPASNAADMGDQEAFLRAAGIISGDIPQHYDDDEDEEKGDEHINAYGYDGQDEEDEEDGAMQGEEGEEEEPEAESDDDCQSEQDAEVAGLLRESSELLAAVISDEEEEPVRGPLKARLKAAATAATPLLPIPSPPSPKSPPPAPPPPSASTPLRRSPLRKSPAPARRSVGPGPTSPSRLMMQASSVGCPVPLVTPSMEAATKQAIAIRAFLKSPPPVQTPSGLVGGVDQGSVGILEVMCSKKEILDRTESRQIDKLEMTKTSTIEKPFVNPLRAAKKYQRSSADKAYLPEDIRTLPACASSLHHLLTNVLMHDEHVAEESCELARNLQFWEVYSFLRDRTRAVRVDLHLQQPWCTTTKFYITIHEICLRFEILSMLLHTAEPASEQKWDQKMAQKSCSMVMEPLLAAYGEVRSRLAHGEGSLYASPMEPAIQRYCVLLLLVSDEVKVLEHLAKLPVNLLRHPFIVWAIHVSTAYANRDYGRFLRLYVTSDVLSAAVLAPLVDLVRQRLLWRMVRVCVPQRRDKMPLDALAHRLAMTNLEVAVEFLEFHGLEVIELGTGQRLVQLPAFNQKQNTWDVMHDEEKQKCFDDQLGVGMPRLPHRCSFRRRLDDSLRLRYAVLPFGRVEIVLGAADATLFGSANDLAGGHGAPTCEPLFAPAVVITNAANIASPTTPVLAAPVARDSPAPSLLEPLQPLPAARKDKPPRLPSPAPEPTKVASLFKPSQSLSDAASSEPSRFGQTTAAPTATNGFFGAATATSPFGPFGGSPATGAVSSGGLLFGAAAGPFGGGGGAGLFGAAAGGSGMQEKAPRSSKEKEQVAPGPPGNPMLDHPLEASAQASSSFTPSITSSLFSAGLGTLLAANTSSGVTETPLGVADWDELHGGAMASSTSPFGLAKALSVPTKDSNSVDAPGLKACEGPESSHVAKVHARVQGAVAVRKPQAVATAKEWRNLRERAALLFMVSRSFKAWRGLVRDKKAWAGWAALEGTTEVQDESAPIVAVKGLKRPRLSDPAVATDFVPLSKRLVTRTWASAPSSELPEARNLELPSRFMGHWIRGGLAELTFPLDLVEVRSGFENTVDACASDLQVLHDLLPTCLTTSRAEDISAHERSERSLQRAAHCQIECARARLWDLSPPLDQWCELDSAAALWEVVWHHLQNALGRTLAPCPPRWLASAPTWTRSVPRTIVRCPPRWSASAPAPAWNYAATKGIVEASPLTASCIVARPLVASPSSQRPPPSPPTTQSIEGATSLDKPEAAAATREGRAAVAGKSGPRRASGAFAELLRRDAEWTDGLLRGVALLAARTPWGCPPAVGL